MYTNIIRLMVKSVLHECEGFKRSTHSDVKVVGPVHVLSSPNCIPVHTMVCVWVCVGMGV